MPATGARAQIWATLSLGTVAILSALVFYNGPIHVMAPWDVFNLLAGGWRIHEGLVPHTDFYNPIGPLVFQLIALGMAIAGPSTAALCYAVLAFCVMAAPWAWFVASRRLPGAMAALAVVFVACLVVAARPLGYDPRITTYAMMYNRWAWVLISILFLEIFLAPRDSTRRVRLGEGVSIGALLAMLFWCKISYFVVGALGTGLAMVLRPPLRAALVWALGTFAAFCVLWKLLFGINAIDYLADVLFALKAQSPGLRAVLLKASLKHNLAQVALFGVLVAALGVHVRRQNGVALALRFWVIAGFLLGSTFLLSSGNAPERSDLPLFFIAGLIVVQLGCGADHCFRAHPRGTRNSVYFSVLLLVAAAYCLPIMWRDGLSIGNDWRWRDYKLGPLPRSQRFDSVSLRDLVIPETSDWHTAYWLAKHVPEKINEGLALIRRHATPDTRIFAAAFTDPFSFALLLPPPEGTPLWWDLGYSFSVGRFPDPRRVFANVNMIIVPVFHAEDRGCCQKTARTLLQIYGSYIDQRFSQIDRSDSWILLQRKPAPGA